MGRSPAPRSPRRTKLYHLSQTRPPGHPDGRNGVVRHPPNLFHFTLPPFPPEPIHAISLPFLRAAFEIVALAAARLGNIPRAAQSVIMTTDQSACAFLSIIIITNFRLSSLLFFFSQSSKFHSVRHRYGIPLSRTPFSHPHPSPSFFLCRKKTDTKVSPRPHESAMPSAGATQPGPSSPDTSRRY